MYLAIFAAAMAFMAYGRYQDYSSSLGFSNYGIREANPLVNDGPDGEMNKPKAIMLQLAGAAVLVIAYVVIHLYAEEYNRIIPSIVAVGWGVGSILFSVNNRKKKANSRRLQIHALETRTWFDKAFIQNRETKRWRYRMFPWLYSDAPDHGEAYAEVNEKLEQFRLDPKFPEDK